MTDITDVKCINRFASFFLYFDDKINQEIDKKISGVIDYEEKEIRISVLNRRSKYQIIKLVVCNIPPYNPKKVMYNILNIETSELLEIIKKNVLDKLGDCNLIGIAITLRRGFIKDFVYTRYQLLNSTLKKSEASPKEKKLKETELENNDVENLKILRYIGEQIKTYIVEKKYKIGISSYIPSIIDGIMSSEQLSPPPYGSFGQPLLPSAPTYEDAMCQQYHVYKGWDGRYYTKGGILFDLYNHLFLDARPGYNRWIMPLVIDGAVKYRWIFFDDKSQQWFNILEPEKNNVPRELLEIFSPDLLAPNTEFFSGVQSGPLLPVVQVSHESPLNPVAAQSTYKPCGSYSVATSSAAAAAAASSSSSSDMEDLGNGCFWDKRTQTYLQQNIDGWTEYLFNDPLVPRLWIWRTRRFDNTLSSWECGNGDNLYTFVDKDNLWQRNGTYQKLTKKQLLDQIKNNEDAVPREIIEKKNKLNPKYNKEIRNEHCIIM